MKRKEWTATHEVLYPDGRKIKVMAIPENGRVSLYKEWEWRKRKSAWLTVKDGAIYRKGIIQPAILRMTEDYYLKTINFLGALVADSFDGA